MEPEGAVPGVQPEAWRRYLRGSVEGRRGQVQLWEWAATTDEERGLAVLPTGYGKTRAAGGVYVIFRGRGIVDRLLWLVPTDALREQLIPPPTKSGERPKPTVAQELRQDFGVPMHEGVVIEKTDRDLRYHAEDRAEIFVATYQQVLAGARRDGPDFLQMLLHWPIERTARFGRWMVVCDEVHHLSVEGEWGKLAHGLPNVVRWLYLSATPIRTDRRPLYGVPIKGDLRTGEPTYDAAAYVSVNQALEEGAIRQPKGHIGHYFVDTRTNDGKELRITTEMLREEAVNDYPTFEVRRGLRYIEKYLSPMLLDAAACLDDKLLRHPGEHQMLINAMSNDHAEAVSNHINRNELITGGADWIGMKRDDSQNKDILRRFQANELRCLVQVDKAGEGFDNKRCSVLVFLNLTRSETKVMQQLGRGLRRNLSIPIEDDILDAFASADTPIADQIRELEASFRTYEDAPEAQDDRGAADRDVKLPQWSVLQALWDRTEVIGPQAQPAVYPEWMVRASAAEGVPIEKLFRCMFYRPGGEDAGGPPVGVERLASRDEGVRLAHYREQVNLAVSRIAGKAVRVMCSGGAFRPEWLGKVKKAIHLEWIKENNRGHGGMIADDYEAKYHWLERLTAEVNAERIPVWMRVREGVWPRQP